MPFKFKKTYKTKFTRSKRPTQGLAMKAYKLAKKATNTMEIHKHSHNGTGVTSANDFVSQMLTDIAEGDLSSSRTGLRIWARSLRVHYECVWGAAANNVDETIRVIIVRDKMQAGVRPTTAQILQEVNTYSTISQRNNETEGKRFIFLYDKVHRNPNQTTGDTYSTGRKLIIPLKFPIHFNGSAGSATDQGKSAIYLFAVADQTTASGLGPQLRYTTRLFFDP